MEKTVTDVIDKQISFKIQWVFIGLYLVGLVKSRKNIRIQKPAYRIIIFYKDVGWAKQLAFRLKTPIGRNCNVLAPFRVTALKLTLDVLKRFFFNLS